MKYFFGIFLFIFFFLSFGYLDITVANEHIISVNCVGLPGCPDTNLKNPGQAILKNNFSENLAGKFAIDFVQLFIKYLAVIAVISLILGGIMYILSGGEDEKIKKAKNWIVWSLVGVFFSVSAWGIIDFIIKITL